jgi:hypothetical protein
MSGGSKVGRTKVLFSICDFRSFHFPFIICHFVIGGVCCFTVISIFPDDLNRINQIHMKNKNWKVEKSQIEDHKAKIENLNPEP